MTTDLIGPAVEKIKQMILEEDQVHVAVALFGQPGAGKSALINRFIGQQLAPEGVKNDVTIEPRTYEWNGLSLVDLPGFDTAAFPADTYLERFDILSYDILLCVFAGKFHAADTKFFQHVTSRGKTCLFVCNKHDVLWQEGKETWELEREIGESVAQQVGSRQEVFFTSCRKKTGLAELEAAIERHLDAAKRTRWILAAKAYNKEFLAKKHSLCKRRILWGAALSAAVAIVPVPGLDLAVDVGVLISLFKYIRDVYGLSDKKLESTEATVQALAPVANEVVGYASVQGVLLLLKQFAGKAVVEQAAKYVPVVGSAVASSLGFALIRQAAFWYLGQCHELAEAFMDKEVVPKNPIEDDRRHHG